jgi:hypothetical protein
VVPPLGPIGSSQVSVQGRQRHRSNDAGACAEAQQDLAWLQQNMTTQPVQCVIYSDSCSAIHTLTAVITKLLVKCHVSAQ